MIKKKQYKIIHWLSTGIWRSSGLSFCQGFTYDEIVAQFKKDKAFDWIEAIKDEKDLIDGADALAIVRTLPGKRKGDAPSDFYYIILKEPFAHTDHDHIVLAHEVIHICQYIFNRFHVDIGTELESFAYTHSYIMQQIIDILRNPQKK